MLHCTLKVCFDFNNHNSYKLQFVLSLIFTFIGHDHGRHHGGGIVVNPGIGSTGLNDPLAGVDPGFNAGSQGGAVFGGSGMEPNVYREYN